MSFISLHNHTHFSVLDAIPTPEELMMKAKELGQEAVAITDHGSLAGVWSAYKAWKTTGVKPIIGCECYFVDDKEQLKEKEKFRHIILIAKNAIGYKNLLTINRRGFENIKIDLKKSYSIIDWKLLEQYKEGLICLTSCGNGILSSFLMKKDMDGFNSTLNKLKSIFGDDLGLEIQANNLTRNATAFHSEVDQNFINRQMIIQGKKHNVKVVPTCNSHYLNKEENKTHDVMIAIASHQPVYSNFRLKYSVPDFYLKSEAEIKDFFSRNYGDEQAQLLIENTKYFADKCENPEWVDPKFSNPTGKELPIFPVKKEKDYQEFLIWSKIQSEKIQALKEDEQFLRYRTEIGLKTMISVEKFVEYQARCEEEFDVLEYHGFSSYMLIVADYVNWAKNNGVATGPGRGSVGGCMVAYLIGIHSADPIKYDLIFARFHNKEKKAYPDVDMDFSTEGRNKVINYLYEKYGKDNVAHVSNINTITPKVYAKDIARACEFGGSADAELGMAIADSIPVEAKDIDDALRLSPIFTEYCKRYPQLLENKAIDGKLRAFSTHAGGIIISQRPLVGLVPVRLDKEGNVALEYDKDQAEENGLVKMDILGLSTLDIIDKTHEIMRNVGIAIPENHDYKDQKTYDLISKGDTFCVFQLGTSGGTAELCRQIQPSSIDDISHINSLARPSAKEMRSPFVQTKAGKKKVSLVHPSLQRSFGKTYGFGLYEESLFYLAQDVAGWTLNEADRLRKMTKDKGKNPEKVKALRKEFIDGGVKKEISEYICQEIWDNVIDKFQGYGFNKSHSIMYSMISYQTAFLKANYPIPFLLANLMLETAANKLNSAEKIQKIKNELRAHKVEILPPDINKSQMVFTLEGDKLITSLNALKFVSDDAIKDIISKRPFKDFTDFMIRVDSKKVRSNTIEALAASGALDSFGLTRKNMVLYCSDFRKRLQVWRKTHDPLKENFVYEFENPNDEWQTSELYAFEVKYVGEGFICKPAKAYQNFFNDAKVSIKQINSMVDKDRIGDIKFIIKDLFEFKIKKPGKLFEKPMLKLLLEDAWGDAISGTIFPSSDENKFPDNLKKLNKMLKTAKLKLEPGIGIRASGSVNMYNDNLGIIINDLYQVVSPPRLPSDLEKKKISKEKTKTSAKISDTEEELLLDGFLSEKDD